MDNELKWINNSTFAGIGGIIGGFTMSSLGTGIGFVLGGPIGGAIAFGVGSMTGIAGGGIVGHKVGKYISRFIPLGEGYKIDNKEAIDVKFIEDTKGIDDENEKL